MKKNLYIGVAVLLCVAIVAVVGFKLFTRASAGPGSSKEKSPLEKMNETESTLAKFARVIDMYHDQYKRYPNGNALDALVAPGTPGRKILGDHIPADAWGHFIFYIPGTDYKRVGSCALGWKGKYFNPDTYQLYSPGSDLEAGSFAQQERKDNINNWDQDRPWRPFYAQLEQAYKAYKQYAH